MILAISESPCCMKPSIKFLLNRKDGLDEDIGWRIPKLLFSAIQSLICKWDDFSCFWVSMLHEAFHQVSAQEDRWFGRWWCFEEFQNGCLVLGNLWYANGMISCIWVSMLHEAFHQVLLKRIYGLEDDDVWKIPKWLLSARQSLIWKWDDFSCFWFSMLHEAFHQVSAKEGRWIERRYWLKNSKMAV